MKNTCLLFVGLSVLALAACSPVSKRAVGADLDAHQCVTSGGYTWSIVRNSCVRIWEEGIQLKNAQDPKAVFAAYVILSEDGTKAELFLPQNQPVVLDRSFTDKGPRWSRPDMPWLLERLPQGWRLQEKGTLLYWAANPADSSR